MTKNVIEIKNLEKYFEVNAGFLNRKKSIVKAVDNISFNIPIGESLGLVGQSGCSNLLLLLFFDQEDTKL